MRTLPFQRTLLVVALSLVLAFVCSGQETKEPSFPETNASHTIYKSIEELRISGIIADQLDASRREAHLTQIHRIATFDAYPMCVMPYPYRPIVQNRVSNELLAKGGDVFYTFDSKDPLNQADAIAFVARQYEKSQNPKLRLAVEVCPFQTEDHVPYYRVVIAYLEMDMHMCDLHDCSGYKNRP